MKTKLILDVRKTQYAQLNSIVMGRVGDKASNTVDVYVVDGFTPYNLNGSDVYFECAKPDNTAVRDKDGIKIIDASRGHFEYTFPAQTFAAIGKSKQAYFSIEKNSTVKATTQDFIIVSIPDALTNRIPSQTYISQLDQLIKDLEAMQLEVLNAAAYQEAHDAKIFAEQAKSISESVKAQLDQIVIAGSIDPETKQARVDETGFAYNLLKERLDAMSNKSTANAKKTSDLTAKVKKFFVTPEEYGAVGDGVTDDYEAIKAMMAEAGHIVYFGKDKTYVVKTFGFFSTVDNLTIDGNGSTIKLQDGSQLLERVKANIETYYENYAFLLGGSGVRVKNLDFKANADNVWFMHNGEKYYGYQGDIGVPGLPNKYITTTAVQCYGNDFLVENCKFYDFGGGVRFNGEVFLGDKKVDGGTVRNCEFYNGFRDQISTFHSKNVLFEDCLFVDNQRKAIQIYLDVKGAKLRRNRVFVNPANIRKWYPTWSPSQPDAELSGFAVKNPGYPALMYSVEDVVIEDNKLQGCANAIFIRDYSKNVTVDRNTFTDCPTVIQTTTGMEGVINVRDNTLVNSGDLMLLTLNKNSAFDAEYAKNVVTNVNLLNNIIKEKGNVIRVDPKAQQDIYKSITVTVEGNECTGTALPIRYSGSVNNLPYFSLIQSRNLVNGRTNEITRYNTVTFPQELKNFYVQSNSIGSKQGAGYDYIKLFTLKSKIASSTCFLTGKIFNTSGSGIHYCNFYASVRTHYDGINSNSIIEASVDRIIGSRAINSLQFVDRLEGTERVTDVFGYVNNESGQTIFQFDSPQGMTQNFTFVTPDSNAWTNNRGTGNITESVSTKYSDDTGWLNLSTSFGSVSGRPTRYRRLNGVISVIGSVSNATNGTTFATLPVGFRPIQPMVFVVMDAVGGKGVELTINTDGGMVLQNLSTNAVVHITATFSI
ncbi:BppU family phage baseplate upper protein [Bacillus cereus]|uniref:BppU family phage baseplate upper protein n=1 Tax=Bacillus cereus TaxID=1396 RepID=UPI00254F0D78|nr:BppU family phage baseplate upper protein [Bacillus cereus]MDK7481278.1 BppU family phage baseplate upper protein [Bacillus cereus]